MMMWRRSALLLALLLGGCGPEMPAPPVSVTIGPVGQLPTGAPAPTNRPVSTSAPAPTERPAPTPAPPTRIAVIGDSGLEGEGQAAVSALIRAWQADYIIALGDVNYPAGEAATIDAQVGQYYHDWIAPYTGTYGAGASENRFFPVLGNHDWQAAGGQPYLDYFSLPGNERTYTATAGPVGLFALNSNPGEPAGTATDSEQAAWLRQELAQTTSCWRIVAFHHSPYSSGYWGPSAWMQWPFADWGADVVLSAHDHHYERLERDGITYIVNGLGGGARYQLGTVESGSQVRYNASHGALLLEVTDTTLSARFVAVDGSIVDETTLSGGCGTERTTP